MQHTRDDSPKAENGPDSALQAASGGSRERPILFVDVDGVISVFGFEQGSQPPGAFHWIDGIVHYGGGVLALGLFAAAVIAVRARKTDLRKGVTALTTQARST